MIEGSDLALWILKNTQTKEDVSYTRLHKTVYLIQKEIEREKPDFQPFYKFVDFMSHTGPYDSELQEDLEILFETRCAKNSKKPYDITSYAYVPTHNMRVSDMGDRYIRNHASKELEKFLGKEPYRKVKDTLSYYDKKSEIELIKESMQEWGKEHPYKKIADLIPQL